MAKREIGQMIISYTEGYDTKLHTIAQEDLEDYTDIHALVEALCDSLHEFANTYGGEYDGKQTEDDELN